MSQVPVVAMPTTPTSRWPDRPDAWEGLRTLIRTRLLIATLALPLGVMLGPSATPSSWWVLGWALLLIGALSAVYALGVRLRRGLAAQIATQIAGDLVVVTLLSAHTGGRDSQFVLFFGLVVVTGGLLGRIPGGLSTALGASGALAALPAVSRLLGTDGAEPPATGGPSTALVIAYLAVLGMLAGVLGERVHRTRADLDRTARELDRVRVDNDTVLRHLTTGVLTVNASGLVGYLNPTAEQVLGLRSLECRGQALGDAFPERLAPMRALVLETLSTLTPRARAELAMHGPSGRSLPIGVSTNLLMHEGQTTGVVAVFQDLTEVREMERRARRNETLAEIGALSARIAHELRNGLNPISGSVECLQRELRLSGENAVLMELIGRECVRLNRFVTDLLNFSRERDLAVESVDVEGHLADVCDVLRRDPRRPIKVTLQFSPGGEGAHMQADRDQLRQVWINLGNNAFESMPDGGTLTVRWRPGRKGQVVVEFEDTGSGIAAEDLPRVGQPFYTTKQGGTGLGLAIASRIVERHGGQLTLDSAPGRGTIARVALPGDIVAMAHAA